MRTKIPATYQAVVNGFTEIATTLDLAASAAPSTGQFAGDDAVAVTDAFQAYSVAQTDVLDSIIDSVGQVGDTVPVFPPLEPATTRLKAVSASANVIAAPPRLSLPMPPRSVGRYLLDPAWADSICPCKELGRQARRLARRRRGSRSGGCRGAAWGTSGCG